MGEQIRRTNIELGDLSNRADRERTQDEATAAERRALAATQETEHFREWHESNRAAQRVGLGAGAIGNLVSISGRHNPMSWSERRRLGLN